MDPETVENPEGVLNRGVTAVNFVFRYDSESSVENAREGKRTIREGTASQDKVRTWA